MVGTSDQSCWLAEACKIPVWGVSGAVWGVSGDRKPSVYVTVDTTVTLSQMLNVRNLRPI